MRKSDFLIQKIIECYPRFGYERKNKDAELCQLIRSLSPSMAVRFGERAIASFYEGSTDCPEDGGDWLQLLAHFHPKALKGFDADIFELGLHRDDPILLHLASMDVVEQIIGGLEDLSEDDLSSDLVALGWACKGNPVVLKRYRSIYSDIPESLVRLVARINQHTHNTMSPQHYLDLMAHQAGWEFLSEKKTRTLHYPIVRRFRNCQGEPPAVKTAVSTNRVCPWTGYRLPIFLQLNLRHPDLSFLELDGEVLNFPAHPQAAAQENFFVKSSTDGRFEIHPISLNADKISEIRGSMDFTPKNEWKFPHAQFVLEEPCMALESVSHDLPIRYSQVGGMPTWEQDARYPSCPDCQKTMFFIAQLRDSEFENYGTGTFYFHYCPDCEVACIRYDCT